MKSAWTDYLNLPLILVIATLVTGIIWLIDALMFAPARRKLANYDDENQPILVEYARSFFPVLLIVLVLRSFLFEPFRIPSGSMIPTLLIGDFILVNKFSYGVRLPVIHTKILDTGKPARGDVAVFRFPGDPRLDYIKRVVGLPGDTIAYHNKMLFVNGKEIILSDGRPYEDPRSDDVIPGVIRLNEDLEGVNHDILVSNSRSLSGEGEWIVPDGHYFMVGDNRDRSNDSRFWRFVPEENLVGKANYVWMHWHDGRILWSRLGDRIK